MPRSDLRARAALLALIASMSLALCSCSRAGASTFETHSTSTGACSAPTMSAAAAQSSGEPASHSPLTRPVTTLPPGVAVGQVQVVVESGSYGPNSTIFAWAGNGLSQCIYAMDHHSDCSVVMLERQVSGGWQPQASCPLATPTRIVALSPMQAAFIRLVPMTTGAQQGAWQAGTYRTVFSYRLDPNGTGQSTEVTSESFTIA